MLSPVVANDTARNLEHAFGNRFDQYRAGRRTSRFALNVRIQKRPDENREDNPNSQNGYSIEDRKVGLSRFFHLAVKPKGEQHSQRCPVAGKSPHPGKMKRWIKFKGKENSERPGPELRLIKNSMTEPGAKKSRDDQIRRLDLNLFC